MFAKIDNIFSELDKSEDVHVKLELCDSVEKELDNIEACLSNLSGINNNNNDVTDTNINEILEDIESKLGLLQKTQCDNGKLGMEYELAYELGSELDLGLEEYIQMLSSIKCGIEGCENFMNNNSGVRIFNSDDKLNNISEKLKDLVLVEDSC